MRKYYSINSAASGREEAAAPFFDNSDEGGLSKAHNKTLSSALFWLNGGKFKVQKEYEISTQKGGGKRGKIY
jgi:hypothetical protein